jgi:hypothetical protein
MTEDDKKPEENRAPWDTPERRISGWKQWAMEKAVTLCAANRITADQLEETANRIYRWTAFSTSKDLG